MSLTALERLDLSDELDKLLEKVKTTNGIELLDLNDQIDAVLVKLGYGATQGSDQPIKPEPTPPDSDQGHKEEQETDPDGQPVLVTRFLAGEYTKQSANDFIVTLRALEPFQGVYLTLDDIKAGAISWINESALQAA